MSERTVVLLDRLADSEGPAAEVVRRVGATPICIEDWQASKGKLRGAKTMAIIFPSDMRGFEELCLEIRAELTAEDVPLIAAVPNTWEPALARLFMFSIDDFVAEGDFEGLEPKLLALSRGNPWSNVNPESGRVIVADPDPARRVLYGRLLRRKGLGVDFAVDQDDIARQMSLIDDVRLILSTADLPPNGARAAIDAFQSEGGNVASMPWVIEGTREQLSECEECGSATVRLLNKNDPPESALFHVNDLLRPDLGDARRSPRLLYGGPATFRIMGSRHLVSAFTYNINRTGVFIRTLVPPPHDSELTIEFRPPYGEGRVRVYGNVVWRKECKQEGGPVVPTGMGVIYTKIPLADGAALMAGYDKLLETTPGEGSSEE